MAKKKEEKITVEAELCVSCGDDSEIVRCFDKAWSLGREWAKTRTPVEVSFIRFVRKN